MLAPPTSLCLSYIGTLLCLPLIHAGSFHCLNSPRQKTETKRFNFGPRPELRKYRKLTNVIADVIGDSSPISPYFFIFELAKMWSDFCSTELNRFFINLFCACKINDELINFGFSDRSVWSLVLANRWAIRWVQTKNDFTFWLIFSVNLNLGLSERPVQKVKWPTVVIICGSYI